MKAQTLVQAATLLEHEGREKLALAKDLRRVADGRVNRLSPEGRLKISQGAKAMHRQRKQQSRSREVAKILGKAKRTGKVHIMAPRKHARAA